MKGCHISSGRSKQEELHTEPSVLQKRIGSQRKGTAQHVGSAWCVVGHSIAEAIGIVGRLGNNCCRRQPLIDETWLEQDFRAVDTFDAESDDVANRST